jgi:autotransporter-associated beta strand protein
MMELLERRVVPTVYTWTPTGPGPFHWFDPANWTPNTGFPNSPADVANVTSALTSNETINLDIPIHVGTLNVGASSGTSTFTIASGTSGSLVLSAPSGRASITKTSGGADQITAPLTVYNNLTIVNAAASPLAFTGFIAPTTKTLTINPDSQTGKVDFTAANALNTGNIVVDGGTLAINTITLSSSRTITIAAGAVVNSSGTLNLNAQKDSDNYPDAVSGAGTLRLASTTSSATSPDIFFNPNDPDSSDSYYYGNRISANIDLGSSQRDIFVRTNDKSFGESGQLADALINGSISGTGGITYIAQNSRSDMEAPLVLGGANTFTGMLEIQRGSVYLNNAKALSAGNVVLMDPAAGNNARLFLWGNNATISSLSSSGAGNIVIANGNLNDPETSLRPATLTVNQKNAGTFSGQMLDYSLEGNPNIGDGTAGALNLVVNGVAALTLTADYDNTAPHTGTTTVNGGTLLVDNIPNASADTGLPTGNVSVNATGSLGGTGSIVSSASSTLTVNAGSTLGGLLAIKTGDLTLADTSTFTVGLNGFTLGNGYNQVLSTGTVTLNNANLIVNPNAAFAANTVFDILSSGSNPGTFKNAPEGATLNFGDQSFTITYLGGATGHDVVLKRLAQQTAYADTAWAGLSDGAAITDADPVTPGNQPAIVGTNAFASVNAAIAKVPALGTVVVNGSYAGGGSGTFAEDVNVNKEISLIVQAGPTSFNSLADSVASSVIILGTDSASNPITLTAGRDNASTTVFGALTGSGNLVKTGSGTMIVAGIDSYTGTTMISSGALQAGSATGLSSTSAYTVSGTLSLNGFSASVASLTGSGIVQNSNATPATLTAWIPVPGSTFSGVLQDGASGGALSLVTTGTGTLLLSDANTYTGSTTVGGGSTLSITTLANGAGASSIGASTNDSSNLVIQGGSTLLYTGETVSTDRGFTLGPGGGTITTSSAASTLTMGGNIANGVNDLTLGGAGSFAFDGVFTGTTGMLTDNNLGNVTFTNNLAFGTANDANTYGSITTGNITVNSGDLTLGSLRLNEGYRFGGVREVTIGSGAILTATGTVFTDPNGDMYTTQIAGPGTLQLRNALASSTNPSLTSDFGPNGGDSNPVGTVIAAVVDVGSTGTQWIVGKTNSNSVSRAAGDLRFDGPVTGSAAIRIVGINAQGEQNFHFVLNADNSGGAGVAPFTGAVFITNADLALTNSNALTAANSVTFDNIVDNNTTNTGVLYLYGHSVTIGSLNDTSAVGTTAFIRNGALDSANGGTNTAHGGRGAPGGIALGKQADSVFTINQTSDGVFNGEIDDGPNDKADDSTVYRTLSIVKTGTATLALDGLNGYSGTTTISGGVLSVANLADAATGSALAESTSGIGPSPSSIGSSTSDSANLLIDGGTLKYTGPVTSTDRLFTVSGKGGTLDASGTGAVSFTNPGAIVFEGSGTTALTLTGTSTAGNTLTPVVANGGGATSVVKYGSGTWDLVATETYTGPTAVNAGTLFVDGSLISPVTVGASATLAGNGTIAAPVGVTGILTAGDAGSTTGKLTVGNLSFHSGSAVDIALNGPTAGSGYDQITGTGTINLTDATLNVTPAVGFNAPAGAMFDILVNEPGTAITGTFANLPEGTNLQVGGNLFTISYAGGASGHDVVLSRVAPTFVYVDTAWAGLAVGTAIPDADPVASGAQPATVGTNAFATVNAGIAAIPIYGTLVVNGSYTGGGSGIYHEDVVANKQITLVIQAGPVSFDSLADSAALSVITLGIDGTNTPITLTVGADNASTTIAAPIAGSGSVAKVGTGTLILTGNNVYTGATTISAGNLEAGSAGGLSSSSAYTVNGTLTLNGFNNSIAGLAGSGTIQNANVDPATLTVLVPVAGSTFSGVLQDGTGGGALGLVVSGTGVFTLSGTASTYTGTTTAATNLSIAALADAGNSSSIGAAAKDPANLVFKGGITLLYNGVTASTDRGFTVGTGGATLSVNTSSTTLTIGGDIANGANNLTLGGAGNLSFGGVFTGFAATSGALTVNGPGNVTFTNPVAFGSANNEATYGSITTGNITVNGGDLTVVNLRLNEDLRPGGARQLAIAAGAIVTATGTVALDPSTVQYVTQIAGPGTLQLLNPSASKFSPSLTEDFGPSGGDAGPWGAVVTATVDVGTGTQWIVGKANGNDVSRDAGDLRFDGPLTGSGSLQIVGLNQFGGDNAIDNFHFVLKHDNSGTGGAPAFTGAVFIANGDLALADNNALTAANSVTFDGVADPNTTNQNVLYLYGHSVTIGSLNDTSDAATTSFIRNGSMDLANGGTNSKDNTETLGVALGVKADSVLTINQTTAGSFNGQINDGPNDNGTGAEGTYRTLSIVKTGAATLDLTGVNAYTGSTTISGGTLSVNSLTSGGVVVTSGLGDSPSGIGSSTNDAANLVLDGGSLQYTGGTTGTDRLFTVTGKGGTLDASGSGALIFTNTGALVFNDAGETKLTLTGTSTASNRLAPIIADGTAKTSVVKDGTGTWDLSAANTSTGPSSVNAGVLQVDGSLASSVTTAAGGILTGNGGAVAAPVAIRGTLSSGNGTAGTGVLKVGNLSFSPGATYMPVLAGAAAGTGYDQIVATGTINLTNATLDVRLGVGFTPVAGSTYDILTSTGDALTGSFRGLAEGATVTAGPSSFKISYHGGASGRDVVLTVTASQLVISSLSSTSVGAGGTVTFTVTAEDSSGHPVADYTGTMLFTSTDSGAMYNGALPATYTFVDSDRGMHTFTVSLASIGSQTVTVADQAQSTLRATTSLLTVIVGPFSKYVVTVLGVDSVAAGSTFKFTVQATDARGNPVTSYSGPTSITVGANPADPQSDFPITRTLGSNGFGSFVGDIETPGSYTLIASASTFSGTSGPITITPATLPLSTNASTVIVIVGDTASSSTSGSTSSSILSSVNRTSTTVASLPSANGGAGNERIDSSAATAFDSSSNDRFAPPNLEFNVNALELLQSANPFLSDHVVPGIASLPASAPVAQGMNVPGYPPLALIATMRSGPLIERPPEQAAQEIPSERVFGLFFHRGAMRPGDRPLAAGTHRENPGTTTATRDALERTWPLWENIVIGARETLRKLAPSQWEQHGSESLLLVLKEFLEQLKQLLGPTKPTQELSQPLSGVQEHQLGHPVDEQLAAVMYLERETEPANALTPPAIGAVFALWAQAQLQLDVTYDEDPAACIGAVRQRASRSNAA